MGERRAKLQSFLTFGTVCYFCAAMPAETVDHVPSRDFFVNRIGPEGFEFPACERCNSMTRVVEQVTALYAMMLDRDEERFSQSEFERKYIGVRNNFPELLPSETVSANDKRKAFQFHDQRYRTAKTFAEEPILRIPDAVLAAFEIFAFKLGLALYHKHFGCPAADTLFQRCFWNTITERTTADIITSANRILPVGSMGARINTDIGKQLTYRVGTHAPSDTFIAITQIRASGCVVATFTSRSAPEEFKSWKTVGQRRSEIIEALRNDPRSFNVEQ